jgi:hypothetical protein
MKRPHGNLLPPEVPERRSRRRSSSAPGAMWKTVRLASINGDLLGVRLRCDPYTRGVIHSDLSEDFKGERSEVGLRDFLEDFT